MMTLEQAIRDVAPRLDKINLFRNRVRGGFEAAVSRGGSTFSIGTDGDPVQALLKALVAERVSAPKPTPPAVEEPDLGLFG